MSWRLAWLFALLITSPALANIFYCPNHHQYVQLGYSQAQVKAACGEPTKKDTRSVPDIENIPTQNWDYT